MELDYNATDALLLRHSLDVPDQTRRMLADLMRRGPWVSYGPRSATQGLEMAETHARALLKYTVSPPSRPNSIAIRSAKLRDALGWLAGLEILLFQMRDGFAFDYDKLCASLDAGTTDAAAIQTLLDTLSRLPRDNLRASGRPEGPAWEIVRTGFIAWQRAGHHTGYRWVAASGTLKGAFPDFMRDLLVCFDKVPMSDKALHSAICRCAKNDDLKV